MLSLQETQNLFQCFWRARRANLAKVPVEVVPTMSLMKRNLASVVTLFNTMYN